MSQARPNLGHALAALPWVAALVTASLPAQATGHLLALADGARRYEESAVHADLPPPALPDHPPDPVGDGAFARGRGSGEDHPPAAGARPPSSPAGDPPAAAARPPGPAATAPVDPARVPATHLERALAAAADGSGPTPRARPRAGLRASPPADAAAGDREPARPAATGLAPLALPAAREALAWPAAVDHDPLARWHRDARAFREPPAPARWTLAFDPAHAPGPDAPGIDADRREPAPMFSRWDLRIGYRPDGDTEIALSLQNVAALHRFDHVSFEEPDFGVSLLVTHRF